MTQIARAAHATKTKGVPFRVLFCYLINTIFSNKSMYRDYLKHQDQLAFSDKTFRNLLNNSRINWQKFLILLCRQIIRFIKPLTDSARQNVFIVDDSMYERAHAKHVELAAFQFDHAKHRQTRGFRFLQLGWSDGNTFLPVTFSLLSGQNQVCGAKADARTHSGKRKLQAQRKAPDVVRDLVSALNQGVRASYVLFDSWFSSPKMFHRLRQLKLHAVAMVKRSKKVYYRFNGQMMDVKTIFKAQKKRRGRSRYLLSVLVEGVVEGEKSLPLKLVYVRNRRKRKDYLVLAATDTQLSEDEIIQLYGKRWSIEAYFKMCKQYLRLAKYQSLSYDGIFAHTSCVVAIAYSLLAVKHREQEDERTLGELFYLMVDELADITFVEAIRQLIDLFQEAFENELVLSENVMEQMIERFLEKLPSSYQEQLKKGAA